MKIHQAQFGRNANGWASAAEMSGLPDGRAGD